MCTFSIWLFSDELERIRYKKGKVVALFDYILVSSVKKTKHLCNFVQNFPSFSKSQLSIMKFCLQVDISKSRNGSEIENDFLVRISN